MTTPPIQRDPENVKSLLQDRRLWLVFTLTILIHGSTIILFADHLTDDRDAYLALATQLKEGHGYRFSPDGPLTAYRPPLYPVVLSLCLRVFPPAFSVAMVNGICSLLIVFLTWRLACVWWNSWWATVATAFVILDPLILINVTLPMTEVMFTGLVLSIVSLATRHEQRLRHRLCLGVCFGLAALCRPTIWPFGVLGIVIWIWRTDRKRDNTQTPRLVLREVVLRQALPVLVAVCLTVAPWVIRNAMVFQSFVPMTTHGGYTLLLANNPVFYEEVVSQGWRTTWQGDSLNRWQQHLSEEMSRMDPPVEGEIATSRWMFQRALRTIRADWEQFFQSCGVRLLRFWNPIPMSTSNRPVPRPVQWGIGCYSFLLFVGSMAGVVSWFRSQPPRKPFDQFPPLAIALMLSFSAVHAVYWSNLRMRTPLEPVLILLAISAVFRWRSSESPIGSDQG